jgi:hypothetical protein
MLIQATKRMIIYGQNLEILRQARLGETKFGDDFPSWVPDFSSKLTNVGIHPDGPYSFIHYDQGIDGYGQSHFRASSNMFAAPTFRSDPESGVDHILQAQGIFMNQLADKDSLNISGTYPKTPNNGIVITKWALDIGLEPKFDRSHPGAVSVEYVCNESYFTEESLSVAFKATIFRGFNYESQTQLWKNYPRRSEILAKSITWHSGNGDWRFFRSPKGYIGLAHWRAEYTDCICVLRGASVPFILRPEGKWFKIVGEAYVHGFMFGHTMSMMRDGELEQKVIEII